jgi:hypothetical protein
MQVLEASTLNFGTVVQADENATGVCATDDPDLKFR